jgi:ATP-dependent Clp protease ATP-binding subunit ClpA
LWLFQELGDLAFGDSAMEIATIERTVLRRVDQVLRPELVARINEKLVFNRLPYAIQREICELMIGREVARLNLIGHNLVVEAATVESLVREGFHRTLGARPMRNTVDRFLQDRAAKEMLVGSV